jgi:hypothetical protein
MENNEILMYLGIFLLSIFIIYFLSRMANIQMNVIEGLTNNKNSDNNNKMSNIVGSSLNEEISNLKKTNEKLNDMLDIDKYKKEYEDVLIHLDEYLDNITLFYLGNSISHKNPFEIVSSLTKSEKGEKSNIEIMNELYKLKENLNSTMDYLDGKKSNSGSTTKNMLGF